MPLTSLRVSPVHLRTLTGARSSQSLKPRDAATSKLVRLPLVIALALATTHGAVATQHFEAPLPVVTEVTSQLPQPTFTIHDALEPLSELIAHGESITAGDYNAANNGWAMDLGQHGLSNYFGRDCSDVTIGEVMLAQDQRRLHAVGRYQIIGTTMRAAVRWAGLSGSSMFTPDNQDKLFLALIKHKRPAIWSYLLGNGTAHQAANALAREWSSMPAPHGGTYYGRGDRAHASRAEVLSVLEQTRKAITLLT